MSSYRRIKILHNTGHLVRGGIEMWLFQMIRRLDPSRFEHHVLVRSTSKEAFYEEFRDIGVKVFACEDYRNPLLYARNLRRLFRENGPYDLLHAHGTHYDGYIVFLGWLFGVKSRIAHSHTDTRPMVAAHGFPRTKCTLRWDTLLPAGWRPRAWLRAEPPRSPCSAMAGKKILDGTCSTTE